MSLDPQRRVQLLELPDHGLFLRRGHVVLIQPQHEAGDFHILLADGEADVFHAVQRFQAAFFRAVIVFPGDILLVQAVDQLLAGSFRQDDFRDFLKTNCAHGFRFEVLGRKL